MSDNVVIAPLALHLLAREGGRAERNGARERARACGEALQLLTGKLPDDLCETWYLAAGYGSAE